MMHVFIFDVIPCNDVVLTLSSMILKLFERYFCDLILNNVFFIFDVPVFGLFRRRVDTVVDDAEIV